MVERASGARSKPNRSPTWFPMAESIAAQSRPSTKPTRKGSFDGAHGSVPKTIERVPKSLAFDFGDFSGLDLHARGVMESPAERFAGERFPDIG